MKKSTLQFRLNRRVTFDRRIEVPSPKKRKHGFADGLIELGKRGFGLSTDAFLKSVEKFLDKEVRTIPFNSRSRSPQYPSHLLRFISRCLVSTSIYIFGIDCRTTLQVQEKVIIISRLPVEIYGQLRSYCCGPVGRILGNIVLSSRKHINFAMETNLRQKNQTVLLNIKG